MKVSALQGHFFSLTLDRNMFIKTICVSQHVPLWKKKIIISSTELLHPAGKFYAIKKDTRKHLFQFPLTDNLWCHSKHSIYSNILRPWFDRVHKLNSNKGPASPQQAREQDLLLVCPLLLETHLHSFKYLPLCRPVLPPSGAKNESQVSLRCSFQQSLYCTPGGAH